MISSSLHQSIPHPSRDSKGKLHLPLSHCLILPRNDRSTGKNSTPRISQFTPPNQLLIVMEPLYTMHCGHHSHSECALSVYSVSPSWHSELGHVMPSRYLASAGIPVHYCFKCVNPVWLLTHAGRGKWPTLSLDHCSWFR